MFTNRKMDTHVHSIASGHAFNTITEIIDFSNENNMQLVCITDHGPSMEGAPHDGFFTMSESIPFEVGDCKILFGCECNIQNNNGILDLNNSILENLDIVLIGLHEKTPFKNSGLEYNTQAIQNAMINPFVDIVSHPYRKEFPVDIDKIVESAKMSNCILEINLRVLENQGAEIVMVYSDMLKKCSKAGVPVVVGSDSHSIYDMSKAKKSSIYSDLCLNYEDILVSEAHCLLRLLVNKRNRKKLIK